MPAFARIPALFVVTMLVLFMGHSTANAQDADELVQRLSEKYEASDGLQARFVQNIRSPYAGGESQVRGSLVLRGDMYRIETEHQTIVTDGRTTWVYNKPENQVLVAHYDDSDDFVAPSRFFTGYAEHYHAELAGRENLGNTPHHVLNLTPREADAFIRNVTVWVRASDTIVTRLRVTDLNETVMDFNLQDISMSPRITADTFRFAPPSGAEVVDLRN